MVVLNSHTCLSSQSSFAAQIVPADVIGSQLSLLWPLYESQSKTLQMSICLKNSKYIVRFMDIRSVCFKRTVVFPPALLLVVKASNSPMSTGCLTPVYEALPCSEGCKHSGHSSLGTYCPNNKSILANSPAGAAFRLLYIFTGCQVNSRTGQCTCAIHTHLNAGASCIGAKHPSVHGTLGRPHAFQISTSSAGTGRDSKRVW